MQSTLDDIQTKRDAGIIQNWDADGQVTGALRNAKGELEASQKVFADLQVAHDTPSRIGVPLGLGAPDQAKNIQGVEDALNEVTKMNRAHDYTLKVGRDAGEEKDLSEKDRLSKEAKEAAARAKEAADKLYAA
jgi:hypothetical protein